MAAQRWERDREGWIHRIGLFWHLIGIFWHWFVFFVILYFVLTSFLSSYIAARQYGSKAAANARVQTWRYVWHMHAMCASLHACHLCLLCATFCGRFCRLLSRLQVRVTQRLMDASCILFIYTLMPPSPRLLVLASVCSLTSARLRVLFDTSTRSRTCKWI